jgi:hypothetical protein
MRIKITLFALLFFLSLSCFSQKQVVILQITCIQPYCGGAQPTEAIELESRKPKPFSNQLIILVSGSGKVQCAKTDSAGYLKLRLKKGNYTLFEEWRYYKQFPAPYAAEAFDKTCLAVEWKKELLTLKVTGDNVEVSAQRELILYCSYAMPCVLETHLPPAQQ